MFSKTIAINLSRDSLSFYTFEGEPLVLRLDEQTLKDLEIEDARRLENHIADFVSTNNLGGRAALLVLSDEILFRKSFPRSENEQNEVEAFINEVPFPPDKLARLTPTTSTEINVIATNKDLYEVIVNSLKRNKIKVVNVIPRYFLKGGNITDESIKEALDNDTGLQLHDFLKSTEKYRAKSAKKDRRKTIVASMLALFGIVFLASTLLYMFVFKGNLPFIAKKSSGSSAVVTKPTEEIKDETEQSTSAEDESPETDEGVDAISAEEINVLVLNGTGEPGAAGSTSDIIAQLNFMEIEIGNAEEQNHEITLVRYSPDIPESIIDSLVKILESEFENVEYEIFDIEEESEYLIIITSGKTLTSQSE
jgi:hypothetical protein